MLARKLLSANSGGEALLYVDDVFSADTYTGNSSTQTIPNGIDLAGEGGLVWIKRRDGATSHFFFDSTRFNFDSYLRSDLANEQGPENSYLDPSATGFTLANTGLNTSPNTYVAWTFRKAPKFFDVVTYTGNGGTNVINHSLGATPGMIIVKCTSNAGLDWIVYHRSNTVNPETDYLVLNATGGTADDNTKWNDAAPTSTQFTVGGANDVNANGYTYVTYLFAHDADADGIIQCGSFTTDGGGNGTISHGWTDGVQHLELKTSSTNGDWEIFDTARTSGFSGSDARLRPNLNNVEDTVTRVSASGTTLSLSGLSASQTYIYMIIRAPAP